MAEAKFNTNMAAGDVAGAPEAGKPPEENRAARAVSPFEEMRREAERMFDAFAPDAFLADPFRAPMFAQLAALARRPMEGMWPFATPGTATPPAVDVAEKAEEYEITAELPGLEPADVDVKVAGGVLTIRAEKRDERERDETGYFFSERRYGTFARSFRLPEDIDRGAIGAVFAKGILTVRLPKVPAAREETRTIAVRAD